MNREKARELLPVIQAYAEGKTVQCRSWVGNEWIDAAEPMFNGPTKDWRVKPEPREWWIFWNGINGTIYTTQEEAIERLRETRFNQPDIIRVREVL